MRGFMRVLAVLAVVAVAVGIGVAIYNAGVTAGLAETAQQVNDSGDAVRGPYGWGYGPYVHGPFGFGWGLFGIVFWILGIFLIIGLVRAAFGGGRWGGPGGAGWGNGRERIEELHRELHRREGGEPQSTAGRSTAGT